MLSIKVLSVQEEERTHLARELHDELGQKLTIIRLNAGYLAKTSGLDKESRYALSDIADATASIQQEVRDLLGACDPMDQATDSMSRSSRDWCACSSMAGAMHQGASSASHWTCALESDRSAMASCSRSTA